MRTERCLKYRSLCSPVGARASSPRRKSWVRRQRTEQPRQGRKKRYLFRPLRGYFAANCASPQLTLWATCYRPCWGFAGIVGAFLQTLTVAALFPMRECACVSC